MALSAAERSRRYRERKKKQGLYDDLKQKHREQQQKSRGNSTYAKRIADRRRDALRKRQSRKIISQQLNSADDHSSLAAYASVQTFGKAMKKATKALPYKSPKKFEVINRLAQSVGLLPPPQHPRVARKLTEATVEKVLAFYERDDISWQAPGKRDTVTIKRNGKSEKIRRRHLLFNLRELHGLYQLELPQFPISRAAFQDLRPPHVKPLSTLSQRVCVCVHHANVHLLLKALVTHVDGLVDDLQWFVRMLVCDDANEECMMRKCVKCQHFFTKEIENKIRNKTSSVTWNQWINNGHRSTKSDFTGTVQQCVAALATKVSSFLLHTWIKREQGKYFEYLKTNVSTAKIVVQVDYSGNFAIGFQDEIQSAHWSKKQLSLFTAHAWLANSEGESFTFISDDITHNKYTVHACLEHLLTTLQRSVPDLQEIHFFSDGAASQFKQRYLFRKLTYLAKAFNVLVSWHFFASHHGKGVVDGLGATVKRLVHQQILTGKDCRNAADFVLLARSRTDSIQIEELLTSEVEAAQEELHDIFMNTRNLPGIQKIHSIDVMDVDTIQYRNYSTSEKEVIFRF